MTAGHPREDARLLLRLEHAVDDLLASHREPEQALPEILEAIGTTLGWPMASVWMWRGDRLRQVAGWHDANAAASEAFERFVEHSLEFGFGEGEGLPGRVWVANRPLWIDELDDPAQFPRATIARGLGLRSALAFPVADAHDGRPEGVVELFRDTREDPDPTLLATLASLGRRLGAHIARAREAALARHGEALLRATVDSALDAVVVVDAEGQVLEFNPAASAVFGWTREEAVGRELPELIIPPELRVDHRRAWTRHLETGHRSILGTRIETEGLRRDGTRFPVELTITEALVDGRPTFTGHLRDLTERRAAESELLASRRRVVSAADEARRQIERNLHDGVQQRMVGLALLLGRARSALPADPAHAQELLDQAVSEISETGDELRRLARGIHPAGLTRYGLAAALTDLARRSGPSVSVGDLPGGRFDETAEVTAYYVVAEAVTNAIRHAPGAQVEISGSVDEAMLVVRVVDDGPGGAADPGGSPGSRDDGEPQPVSSQLVSSGLSGLRDRVNAVGGTLRVISSPERGTEVVGRLPLASPTP